MFIPVFALNKRLSLYQEADFETHFSGTSPDRPLYKERPPLPNANYSQESTPILSGGLVFEENSTKYCNFRYFLNKIINKPQKSSWTSRFFFFFFFLNAYSRTWKFYCKHWSHWNICKTCLSIGLIEPILKRCVYNVNLTLPGRSGFQYVKDYVSMKFKNKILSLMIKLCSFLCNFRHTLFSQIVTCRKEGSWIVST